MATIGRYQRLTDSIRTRAFAPRSSDLDVVSRINATFRELTRLSDDELAQQTAIIRSSIAAGESIFETDIVVSTFALVKESARRSLGLLLFDVQLLAGIAMATGAIVEMQTGEGKTLASTLPVVLHALSGNGVHVATVNSYLAARDFEYLRPLYELLGLSTGFSRDGDPRQAKRQAYAADITYATGYELGFDYLRDQVSLRHEQGQPIGRRVRNGLRGLQIESPVVQRGHAFVVIDEVDSVLIDEASTPLILSAANGGSADAATYEQAKVVSRQLDCNLDFIRIQQGRDIRLTEAGSAKVHTHLPSGGRGLVRPWSSYVEQALRAEHLHLRDVDYVIHENKVLIVDEYTGRIFTERSWRDGLHQAIEAKEGLPITEENRSIARVSRQQYFRMYGRICGMTGTASGHEQEFHRFYRLPVVSIPLRKTCRRELLPTRYFANATEKWNAIAEEIGHHCHRGQPVLVGTRTIANSHLLASLLTRRRLPFRLLNGIQDDDEAALIATAGDPGMVTIATNMAGRGTDIKLPAESIKLGGLHVISAERHDSARIDRQLAGRAARQGDPGSCRFFVSADDPLLADSDVKGSLAAMPRSGGVSNRAFDAAVSRIQSRAEFHAYEKRKQLMNYELWLDNLRSSVA